MLQRNYLAEKPSKVSRSDYSFRLQVAGFKFLLAAWRLHLAALFLLTGCSISHGVYHKVEKGQTLWRIAKAYNVDIQEVAEWNDIADPTEINTGEKIFIPGAWRLLKVEPYKAPEEITGGAEKEKKANGWQAMQRTEEPAGKIVLERWRFAWPVKGSVISPFGMRSGKKHDGIDIAAPEGSAVLAAAEGEIMHSDDSVRGYGNMVILKHKEGFITIYAHNEENLVKTGDVVKRGDVIARLGNTGHSSGPHLHFEVRKDRRPRNPLFFLP